MINTCQYYRSFVEEWKYLFSNYVILSNLPKSWHHSPEIDLNSAGSGGDDCPYAVDADLDSVWRENGIGRF